MKLRCMYSIYSYFSSIITVFPCLFLQGMELFEEALQKWEQALNIRHRVHSTSSNNSLALQGAACADIPTVRLTHSSAMQECLLKVLCMVGLVSSPSAIL